MISMKNKEKNKFKLSVKWQISLAFLGLLVLVIAVCAVMNTFFLEKYYIKNKKTALLDTYYLVNSAFNDGNYDSEETQLEIQRVCGTYNITLLVVDETTNTVLAFSNNTDTLSNQLFYNFFGAEFDKPKDDDRPAFWDAETILEQNSDYTIKVQSDFRSGDQYLEMWGILDNGNIFILRSPIDSIAESVSITNRFLLYIGLLAAGVSVLFALWASKKISKPISELTVISEKMKNLDFDAKYTGQTHNEIGILGDNINELSETLEKTISELKTANVELEKDLAQKTEIDEMRKEFLSNVSHELKTPLAIVSGYAEGLKDCVNDDAESRDYYCDVIIDETSKMNAMVKKLLTLNQLEFGTDTITVERFDIVLLIKNFLQSVDILIKQCNALVTMDEYEPTYVWGDEFKTEEVFSNYFSNALNHLDGERKIDISIRNVADDIVRVSVFNTGKPIPEDSIEHVWDKFYKVDKARTREYGGSGVGLSIVKAIQESQNQAYGVINYNNGVEFYFDLDANSSEK